MAKSGTASNVPVSLIQRGGGSGPQVTGFGTRISQNDKKKDAPKDPVRFFNVTTAAMPHLAGLCWKTFLGVTLTLYLLNQKHMLPMPLGRIVSKALFWPTLPITVSKRIGSWSNTVVDDTVVLGGAPFGFCNIPEKLYHEYGVRGVINLCDEYGGPIKKYEQLGMQQLRLRTVDHFEPSVNDLKTAVSFIRQHQARGEKVYVHCRAGHGRSAAAVFAWLLYKDPIVDAEKLNAQLCSQRNVRPGLWKQPHVREFHSWLKHGGVLGKNEHADSGDYVARTLYDNEEQDKDSQ